MRATNDEKRRESPEKTTATQATTPERSRPNGTTNGVRARPTESKKATATKPREGTETKSQTSEQQAQQQQSQQQPQEPPLIVRVRDTSPPDPELLSKIGCRCLVIDLPGVLAEMLTVTYRGGFVRVEGQRTVGRVKAFRKKFPLNHEQVVTRMLSAFLNHGVLVIVTPTKVAASMAAAAMVAAQIASKGYKFPTTMNPPPTSASASVTTTTTTTPPSSHKDIPRKPRPLLLMQDPAEIGQPVKFSNDVQITAGTTTAAPQPKSAFGPYQIDTAKSTTMLDGESILSDEEDVQEPPSISIPPSSKQPRKFFFTTGLPRNKHLQKYPSDESGISGHLHRFPSDERTNKSRSIRIEEEEGPAYEEKKTDDGERLQGNVSWTDTSLSDEPSDVVRSHAHAKAQAQAHAHAATPPRRRSIEEYDVILEDRLTMLSPIREEPQPQPQQEHNSNSDNSNSNRELQASSPVASTSTTSSGANNRPLTWAQFEENVWPDNAENMMVRSNSNNNPNDENNHHDTTTTTKTLELTYQHHYAYHHYDDDEKDAERKRLLLGMHGNPDGLLEQRGIMLPFEDELMDDREDDRSLRMELEPHPYWRSAPFLPPRLETIDYVADTTTTSRAVVTSDSGNNNNNMIVREPQKVPSPSLLRRNRLSARKTVTWVDEI